MDLYNEILHWSLGVITSVEPDEPELKNALVRGDNMQFTSIGAGKAKPRSREGLSLVNSTPFSNTSATAGPKVVGGGDYPYLSGGATTHYLLVVQNNGDVHLVLDDGTSTNLTPNTSFVGALTNLTIAPTFALMNNRAFVQDGLGGRMSLKGNAEVDWGVDVPTGLALTSPNAGVMNGAYDILVTGWNSDISAESDRSAVVSVTGLVNKKIIVTVDSVAVGLTNRFFRVYIRKPTLGSGFFRVNAGTGYNSTEDAFPLNSASPIVSTEINIADATYSTVLTLTPPDVSAHGLPPTDSLTVAVWQRRLFVSTPEGVYWSELDKPDAFNPASFEPIKARDPRGGNVVGMREHAGVLHIFTNTARITLTGDTDIRTWVWDTADSTVGLVSPRALVTHKKKMFWYDKDAGPMMMDQDLITSFIGQELIKNSVTDEVLAFDQLSNTSVAASNGYVVFYVPEFGKTRLTKGIVFHAQLNRWVSTRWDPMDASAIFVGLDDAFAEHLYLGNYNGQVFRFFSGDNDGVRSGTKTGTFVAAAGTISAITDLTAAFDTTGAGLIERKVTVLDADGLPMTTSDRPYITANTATGLTLSGNIAGLTVGATYTYIVGGPDMVLETFWDDMQLPFVKKRFDRAIFQFRAETGLARINLAVAVSSDATNDVDTQINDAAGALWDEVNWDEFIWDSPNIVTYQLPIIKSGLNYRMQFRSPWPDQGFTLLKAAMLARQRGDRYRRG